MMNSNIRKNINRRNSQRRLASLVAREMASAMHQHQLAHPPTPTPAPTSNPRYNIKNFTSCNPPKYSGSDGATALLQWFEGIESAFSISECPTPLHVKYAASLFSKRALTWWNKEKATRSMEAAHAMPWTELKTLMLAEFCPRNEVKKLEAEFGNLKQIGGNNSEYTTRFHELSLLVPRMVTPDSVAVEKYLDGLPPKIRDMVLTSRSANLEDAIRLAASLTDNLVNDGELVRTKGNKKRTEPKSEGESSKSGNKKQKVDKTATVHAITAPPQNPTPPPPPQAYLQYHYPPNPAQQIQTQARKPYTGTLPQCPTCHYHHLPTSACRVCTNCNRYGHLVNFCRSPNVAPPAAPVQAPALPQQPPARARAFVLNANQAQDNNEEANNP